MRSVVLWLLSVLIFARVGTFYIVGDAFALRYLFVFINEQIQFFQQTFANVNQLSVLFIVQQIFVHSLYMLHFKIF